MTHIAVLFLAIQALQLRQSRNARYYGLKDYQDPSSTYLIGRQFQQSFSSAMHFFLMASPNLFTSIQSEQEWTPQLAYYDFNDYTPTNLQVNVEVLSQTLPMMQQYIQTFDYATSISNFIDFAYEPRELLRYLQIFEDPERNEQTLITPTKINQLLQQMVALELQVNATIESIYIALNTYLTQLNVAGRMMSGNWQFVIQDPFDQLQTVDSLEIQFLFGYYIQEYSLIKSEALVRDIQEQLTKRFQQAQVS